MPGKLKFVDSPTEQTTAITDAILAVMAIAAAIYLPSIGQQHPWKANLWAVAFAALAIAALLGTIAHGLKLSDITQSLVWMPLYLMLGLTVALFVVGAILDLWGVSAAQQSLPWLVGLGLIFFGLTLIWSNTFTIFIIYEAVAMLFALGGYLSLAIQGQLAGAWLMVAGILVTIIAAGVQTSRAVGFEFVWQFDHNGAYHLIQLAGMALLVAGLQAALLM